MITLLINTYSMAFLSDPVRPNKCSPTSMLQPNTAKINQKKNKNKNVCADSKLVRIEPGIYSFAFQCDLPDCLPTSCEEKYGYIRYLATVHIERPDIPDKTFSTAFTVIKPCNLNADPIYQVRIWLRCVYVYRIYLYIKYVYWVNVSYACNIYVGTCNVNY